MDGKPTQQEIFEYQDKAVGALELMLISGRFLGWEVLVKKDGAGMCPVHLILEKMLEDTTRKDLKERITKILDGNKASAACGRKE